MGVNAPLAPLDYSKDREFKREAKNSVSSGVKEICFDKLASKRSKFIFCLLRGFG